MASADDVAGAMQHMSLKKITVSAMVKNFKVEFTGQIGKNESYLLNVTVNLLPAFSLLVNSIFPFISLT